MMKKPSFIIPYLVETNGKVERFLAVARKQEVKKEYEELLLQLHASPQDVGKKLREAVWAKKGVDDIAKELESGKGR